MQFPYRDHMINLLDTPGHEDFSEDTYRTLTAVDSALMVLDGGKGVEPRTIALMDVCRLRDTPIVSFINKLDRDIRDPIELLDEIEAVLKIKAAPITWPIGCYRDFKGVYHLADDYIIVYTAGHGHERTDVKIIEKLDSDEARAHLGDEYERFIEQLELVQGACHEFNQQEFLDGQLTPVFFGTALGNFGVDHVLDAVVNWAPKPLARVANERTVEPVEEKFTGFVFKIQANMDPKHRDRIAMVRLCSGRFERGMKLKVQNTGRQLSVNAPIMFFASDRELAQQAFAGDVIGIPNHGVLRVGDSLSETGLLRFAGLPNFAPEILQRVRVKDPLKAKHLKKALEGLAEEGVTQLFRPQLGADFIVGAVGPLQFEVMADRLSNEYQLDVIFEPSPYAEARWLTGAKADIDGFVDTHKSGMAYDIDEQPVFLAKTAWDVGYAVERNPKIGFERTKERA